MGKNLEQALFLLYLVALAVVPANLAFAQNVTRGDLGIEETGILPSNPFYFFKTWSRSIRQTFSFSDLSRAELQLNIVNEQAAEIKKLEEINPDKFPAFLRAVVNLDESLASLKARVIVLKGVSGVDKFVAVLLDKAIKFQDILDVLVTKFKDNESADKFYATVSAADDKLVSIVAYLPGNIIDVKKFTEIFEAAVAKQKGELREFRAAEFVDYVGIFATPAFRGAFLRLKDSLLLQWGGRLQALEQTPFVLGDAGSVVSTAPSSAIVSILSLLENTPGNILRRIKVLDEAREKILDQDLKNQINIIRQRILDKAKTDNLISEADAKRALSDVESKIGEATSALKSGPAGLREDAAQLLERARFNFEGAKQFFDDEVFTSAYSQSLTAAAAAENALSELTAEAGDYSGELRNVRQYFDSISFSAAQAGLNSAVHPRLFRAMSDAEGQIAKVSDLVGRGADSSKISLAMRKLKVAMSTLGQRLEGALQAIANARITELDVIPGVEIVKDAMDLVAEVAITSGQFVPSVSRVKKGTTVTWTNNDSVRHRVFSVTLPGLDALSPLNSGDTYSFLFGKEGSWKYSDRFNPAMVGIVVVE